jgi:hypothetical protein
MSTRIIVSALLGVFVLGMFACGSSEAPDRTLKAATRPVDPIGQAASALCDDDCVPFTPYGNFDSCSDYFVSVCTTLCHDIPPDPIHTQGRCVTDTYPDGGPHYHCNCCNPCTPPPAGSICNTTSEPLPGGCDQALCNAECSLTCTSGTCDSKERCTCGPPKADDPLTGSGGGGNDGTGTKGDCACWSGELVTAEQCRGVCGGAVDGDTCWLPPGC